MSKLKSIPIMIEIDGDYCGYDCVFNIEGECTIFNEKLDAWDAWRNLRCNKCYKMEELQCN